MASYESELDRWEDDGGAVLLSDGERRPSRATRRQTGDYSLRNVGKTPVLLASDVDSEKMGFLPDSAMSEGFPLMSRRAPEGR
jgi:hypothetical protein